MTIAATMIGFIVVFLIIVVILPVFAGDSPLRVLRYLFLRDPYSTYLNNPAIRRFEFDFLDKTELGFDVQYTFVGHFTRVDDKAFRKAQMLDPKRQQETIAAFNKDVVRPIREKGFRWAYGFAGDHLPRLLLYRIDLADGQASLKLDPSCCDLIKAVKEQPDFIRNGVRITLTLINKERSEDPLIIRGNYNKMSSSEIALAADNITSMWLEEYAVIRTLKRIRDIESELLSSLTDHEYKQHYYSLSTRLVNDLLQVTWRFNRTNFHRGHQYELLGFRKEGGFHDDQSTTGPEQGTLIVQSSHDTSTTEKLRPDQTYYYTFMVRSRKGDETQKWDALRFTVYMPNMVDRIELAEKKLKLAKRMDNPKARLAGTREHINEVVTSVKNMEELLMAKRKETQELESNEGIDPLDKEDLMRFLKDAFGAREDKLRRDAFDGPRHPSTIDL